MRQGFRLNRRLGNARSSFHYLSIDPRELSIDYLESRLCLSTISFIGSELVYTASAGIVNKVTLSLSGDVYTIYDSGERVTQVTNAPAGSKIGGIAKNGQPRPVTLQCQDNQITSVTFNLGDGDDALTLNSARDGISLLNESGKDRVIIGGSLNLSGSLSLASEAIVLQANVVASGDISLVIPDSPAAGDDLIIPAGITLRSTGGAVVLRAGDNIDLQPSSAVLASGQLIISADYGNQDLGLGSETRFGGLLQVASIIASSDSDDDLFRIDDNGAAPGGTVNNLRSPIAIEGGAGRNSLDLMDSSDLGVNVVSIFPESLGTGSGDNFFGQGGRITKFSQIDLLTVYLGSLQNSVVLSGTSPGMTTIYGGIGSDALLAGNAARSLDDIHGDVAFLAGPGTDRLILDDSGATTTADYLITSDLVTRITGSTLATLSYRDLETIELTAGRFKNSVALQPWNTSFPAVVSIRTGDDDDQVMVSLGPVNVSTRLQIDTGRAADTLRIRSGNGNNNVTLADSIIAGNTVISAIDIEQVEVIGGENPVRIDASKFGTGVSLFGGPGDDELIGSSGDDILFGGTGNDVINAGRGNDRINTGDGNDVIFGGDGDNFIDSGDGSDIIFGGVGNDRINAGTGNDRINSGDGNDIIFGGGGNDTINSGSGNDVVNSGDGNDVIFGVGGNDTINSGDGNDVIFGGDGNDVINAGADDDEISAGDGDDIVFGGDGDDQLSGEAGSDILIGGKGNDVQQGGGGDDLYLFIGSMLGSDTLIEAPNIDTDTLDFSSFDGPVFLDLARLQPQTIAGDKLSLTFRHSLNAPMDGEFTGIESVVGSSGADVILGNSRDNQISGADLFNFLPVDAPLLNNASTQWVFLDFDSQTDAAAGEHVYTAHERGLIESRLVDDYRLFNFAFTQEKELIPQILRNDQLFATLFFNKASIVNGRPVAGLADELDFRNLNLGGSAAIDVSILLGAPGEPAASSDNYVAASAAVGAHELGHLVGLRHADSFGPIGFGIHDPPGVDAFRPAYPGPTMAFETEQHIMASPASVGSSLSETVGNPYFEERSAIKLAFNERGTVIGELTSVPGDHGTLATAQAIKPVGLFVPNPLQGGLNAGKNFAVEAIDVVGAIQLDGAGNSEGDFYSFAGHSGDLFNVEVLSGSLNRISRSIDPVVRILNSNGTILQFQNGLAENDDSFEPTDSLLLDVRIPTDGTYYVEVEPFAPSGGPHSDTGDYELFLYRFDAGNPHDVGDRLEGRTGADVLEGGLGNDILDGGTGNDLMAGGLGDDTFILIPHGSDILSEPRIGGGIDTLDFTGAAQGITIDLRIDDGTPQAIDSSSDSISLFGVFENVLASPFNDVIFGNGENNTLSGESGDDILRGFGGNDALSGSTGRDYLDGGDGQDLVFARRDQDMVLTDSSLAVGNDDIDTLSSIEQALLEGGGSSNMISASQFTGQATIFGFGGDDVLTGGSGNDYLSGGDGNDQLTAGNGNDIVMGGSGDDHLVGGAGLDFLVGGLGSDRLVGGANDDLLIGGSTLFDGMDVVLHAISDFWSSALDYQQRVTQLRSGIAASKDAAILEIAFTASTILDDGAVDSLTGSSDRDWFLIFGSGDITDRKPPEELD